MEAEVGPVNTCAFALQVAFLDRSAQDIGRNPPAEGRLVQPD